MFLAETLIVLPSRGIAFASNQSPLLIPVQSVHSLQVDPLGPDGGIAVQPRCGEDAIAGCVLDVDVEIVALHLDHNVEVDIQLVRNALLHLECVHLCAAPPSANLGPEEDDADYGHCYRPFSAAGCVFNVLRFGFGYGLRSHMSACAITAHINMPRHRAVRSTYGKHQKRRRFLRPWDRTRPRLGRVSRIHSS